MKKLESRLSHFVNRHGSDRSKYSKEAWEIVSSFYLGEAIGPFLRGEVEIDGYYKMLEKWGFNKNGTRKEEL